MKEPWVYIQSYFTLQTDLKQSLCDWPEFIKGDGNEMLLRSDSGEEVSLKHVERLRDGIIEKFVAVRSSECGPLFQRTLGLTAFLLAEKGDLLILHREEG